MSYTIYRWLGFLMVMICRGPELSLPLYLGLWLLGGWWSAAMRASVLSLLALCLQKAHNVIFQFTRTFGCHVHATSVVVFVVTFDDLVAASIYVSIVNECCIAAIVQTA